VPPLAGRPASGSIGFGGTTVVVIPAQVVTAPGASEPAGLPLNAATIPASLFVQDGSVGVVVELGLGLRVESGV